MNTHLSFPILLETFSHGVCCTNMVFCALTAEFCARVMCMYNMFTPFVRFHEGTICVFMCVVYAWVCVCLCLARLGLFGQLFGGKAWSHVTLCFSSCSRIRTTRSLCQETRRTGPNPVYPAFSGFLFSGLLLLVTEVGGLVQRINPFREKSGKTEVDLIKVKSSVLGKCCHTATKQSYSDRNSTLCPLHFMGICS